MKKRATIVLSGALLCVLATTAFATNPIQLLVNGQEVTHQPLQMVDGSTYAPVRAVAEALGAKVTWDGAQQQVRIEGSDASSMKRQVDLLVQALAPSSAQQAATTWAKGIAERNGALQYAVWSPELREQQGNALAELGWVTGTSSPWVQQYDVQNEVKLDESTYSYDVVFSYATSTGPAGQGSVYVTVKKYDDHWLIDNIGNHEPLNPLPNMKSELTLPTGEKLLSPATSKLSDKVALALETLTIPKGDELATYTSLIGNHSEIKATESVSLPVGTAKLFTVERTAPAASNNHDVQHEYWLILLTPANGRSDLQYAYTLSTSYLNQEADASSVKSKLLEVAKTWVLPQK